MNKYQKAYLNVDTNSCDENDCYILESACKKAEAWDLLVGELFIDKFPGGKCVAMVDWTTITKNDYKLLKELKER